MKKLLILLVAVLLVFSLAAAESFSPVGTWYLVECSALGQVMVPADIGLDMTFVLNADGTGSMTASTQEGESPAVWTMNDGVVAVTTTDDGMTIEFQYADGKLSGSMTVDSITVGMVMSQEKSAAAEMYVPSPALSAADVSLFDGAWYGDCVYIAAMDMTVSYDMIASALESSLSTDMRYITISNGKVELLPDQPGMLYFDGFFADGMIKVANTTDPTQIVCTVELLTDGKLCLTINGIPMYYDRIN